MQSRKTSSQRFFVGSVGIALLAVLGAVLAGTVGSPENEGASFELRKYLIQFFLVTALGALVGIVVYEYRKRREASDRQRQYASDSVASVLGQLDAIYRSVKKTRRLLRLSQSRGLDRYAYVEAMLKLDEDQQDLEQLKRELKTLERQSRSTDRTRTPELAAIHDAIQKMERYLGDLWGEHEDVAGLSDREFKRRNLERINAFSARVKTGNSDFYRFNGEYHDARDKLIELLAQSRIGHSL